MSKVVSEFIIKGGEKPGLYLDGELFPFYVAQRIEVNQLSDDGFSSVTISIFADKVILDDVEGSPYIQLYKH